MIRRLLQRALARARMLAAPRRHAPLRPSAEAIDPRVLYSADPLGQQDNWPSEAVVQVLLQPQEPTPAKTAETAPAGISPEPPFTTTEPPLATEEPPAPVQQQALDPGQVEAPLGAQVVAFVDASMANDPRWADSLPAGTERIQLNDRMDGVLQIAQALQGREGLDAIHVITRSSAGHLPLGDRIVDEASMTALYADAWAHIGQTLRTGGELRIHGEAFSSDDKGRLAAQTLADLTGARLVVAYGSSSVDNPSPAQTSTIHPSYATRAHALASLGADGEAAAATAPKREIVFVDSAVADSETLVQALRDQRGAGTLISVVHLAADKDALSVMSQALVGEHGLSAVHVLSHGEEGRLLLGGSWIDAAVLAERQAAFGAWQGALAADGDVLLWGCNVGTGPEGERFVQELGRLSGGDVAASIDITGNADRGGDWELELRTGQVETTLPQTEFGLSSYAGTLAVFTVSNLNNTGAGSLRQAIIDANAAGGADTISFSAGILGGTINLTSALPSITGQVSINGNNGSTPGIVLNGGGTVATGLQFDAGASNSTLRGLVVQNFSSYGIRVIGASGVTIAGNHVGTNAAGTAAAGNNVGIDLYDAANTTIGGTVAADRNIISGNTNIGVNIVGSGAGNSGTVVQGNTIGINAAGSGALGNTFHGIYVNGSTGVTIGGTASSAGNLIGNNGTAGITLDSTASGNTIAGNNIGLNLAGNGTMANTVGVWVMGSNNSVGSTVAGAGNVISGNTQQGIRLSGASATGNTVLGNYIGTGLAGTTDMGNGDDGIQIDSGASNNTIGGTASGAGNIVSGNNDYGITLADAASTGNKALGNWVGVGSDGTTLLGNGMSGIGVLGATGTEIGDGTAGGRNVVTANGQRGIYIDGAADTLITGNWIIYNAWSGITLDNAGTTGTVIGGDTHEAANLVAYNTNDGILLANSASAANAASILSNNIYSNGQRGIDLGDEGVTANDGGDGDSGPNGLQNFPVLTAASTTAAGTSFSGSLNSTANTNYRVDFYANRPANVDGSNGEGERWLGYTVVAIDGTGTTSFSHLLSGVWINQGDRITATATRMSGGVYQGTSEFAANITGTSTNVVVVDTTSDSADGTTSSITNLGNARGGDGRISLREAMAAANNTANGASADRIVFAIAPNIESGNLNTAMQTPTIAVASNMTAQTQAVNIDATTQPGYAGTPIVRLDASGAVTYGLQLNGGSANSTIRGLSITGFTTAGISINSSNTNTIASNYIGLAPGGVSVDGNQRGILITSSTGTTVGGLTAGAGNVISGNNNGNLYLLGAVNSLVFGNLIGTDATGTLDADGVNSAVGRSGVYLDGASTGNQIGDTAAGAGNLISGNDWMGVDIISATATNNTIAGNLIGVDISGLAALGNDAGISFFTSGTGNRAVGNVLAGNATYGVQAHTGSSGAFIQGNYIGLGIDGSTVVGTQTVGVYVYSGAVNTVIGTNADGSNDAAEGNVISGNAAGVIVSGAGTTGTVIAGNTIGLAADGNTARGNVFGGVSIWSGATLTTLGGTAAGAGNVISGNGGDGVVIADAGTSNNVVQGNTIGMNLAQTITVGNGAQGIWIGSGTTNNTIGGTAAGAANIITGATYAGIEVNGAATTGNALLGNSIFGNAQLGIDLIGNSGVTANDAGDADTGANNLQNFPVLATARTNASNQLILTGTLNSAANSFYRIEFFSNTSQDSAGFGEGRTYLGFANVATDGSGNATISTTLTANVPVGRFITATATRATDGTYSSFTDTSEFARNISAISSVQATVTVDTTSDTSDGDTTSISTLLANKGADGLISLREAIAAANGSPNGSSGADRIDFAIGLGDAGFTGINGVDGRWVLTLASALPQVTDSVIIDGTTQTTNVANSNPGTLGTGGIVGTDGLSLGTVNRPEIEIVGSASITTAIDIAANNVTLRGFAIRGVGATGSDVTINVGNNFTGTLIEQNVLGTSAVSFTDPGAGQRNWRHIAISGADSGTVQNNLFGFSSSNSLEFSNTSTNWLVSNNELRDGGFLVNGADAIAMGASTGITVQGNLITGTSGQAVVAGTGSTNLSIVNNTVSSSGIATAISNPSQTSAIAFRTTVSAVTVDRNIISGNYGAGVAVNNGATGVRITQNSITGNGTITSRNGAAASGQIGIDLSNTTDDGFLGTAPFVTANDTGDADLGGNNLQNFPVLATARTNASNQLIMTGTLNSAANSFYRIEFFSSTSQDGTGFGEGQTYLGFANVATDGSGNATISTTLGANVPVGAFISATATRATDGTYTSFTDTSEFARNILTVSSTQAVVTVDTASDTSDGDTTSISTLLANKGADGLISLREAIAAANGNPNGSSPDLINFAISGTGVHTIAPLTALPQITDAVVLDASTDDSFAANGNRPAIVLDGNDGAFDGLQLTATADGSTIRGLVVRDFGATGISVHAGSDNHSIVGNYIGALDSNGQFATGEGTGSNALYILGSGSTVGGTSTGLRNVIAGAGASGIWIENGASNTVVGNYIGLAANGNTVIGSNWDGVTITNASNNRIGGTGAGEGNRVAGAGDDGIEVNNGIGTGNAFLGNIITGSGSLGIDLGGNDSTPLPNDTGDADSGGNNLQNYPVLATARTNASNQLTLTGTLNSTASSFFRIELFANTGQDSTGHGEGQTYLGFANVATDGSGNATISNTLAVNVPVGAFITATATRATDGTYTSFTDTSEFARNIVTVSSTQAVVTVDTDSDTSDGDTTSLSTLLADKGVDGFISLREAMTAANNTANGSSADLINFAISGTGVHTITPLTALPTITEAVILDASTDDSFAANGNRPAIILDGNDLGGSGLVVGATGGGSTIRGLVIRDFSNDGIHIQNGSHNNWITGNYLGSLTTTGTHAGAGEANAASGIYVDTGATGTVVGGSGAGQGNVLSGNLVDGIDSRGTGMAVTGNLVGTDASGTLAIGNGQDGISLADNNNRIGGTGTSEGNVIAFNSRLGVDPWTTATGNVVLSNRIFDNGSLALDLGLNGVTLNDAGDADTGANNQQNFPVLAGAITNGASLTVNGRLNSQANSFYRIEFFANSSTDASGHGEGQTYVGFANVATDTAGNAAFAVTFTAAVPAGWAISATATRATDGTYSSFTDTSEFAANVLATDPVPPANTVPGAQTSAEDTARVFSSANGNTITITDSDAGGADNQVTLRVTNGTLTLATTAGLSFVSGDGTADASMTLRGTAAAINTALDGLSFAPDAEFNGGAVLTVATQDSVLLSLNIDTGLVGRYAFENPGNLGLDGSPSGANSASTMNSPAAALDGSRGNVIELNGNNGLQAAGVMGSPANVTLAAWVNLTAADAFGAEVISLGDRISLRLDQAGQLYGQHYNGSTYEGLAFTTTLAGTGWHHVAFTFDDTNNTRTLYLDGVAVASQSTSDSVNYSGATSTVIGRNGAGGTSHDFTGRIDEARIYNRALTAQEIAVLAEDLAMMDTDTVAVTVTPVNDVPVNTAPATLTVAEDGSLAVTGLSIADPDAGSSLLRTEITVSAGTLSASSGGSVTVIGSGSASLVLTGTLSDLNAYLAGASRPTYTPVANANGTVNLSVVTADGLNTGTGGVLQTGQLDYRFQDGTPAGSEPNNVASTGGITGAASDLNVNSLANTLSGSNTSFGVIYTGAFDVTTAGSYTFNVTADDAARLLVNGSPLLLAWFGAGSGSVTLGAGRHSLEVRYAQDAGGAGLSATISGPDTGGNPVALLSTGALGRLVSPTASTAITITAVNDAPVFTNLNGNPVFTDGGLAVVLDADVTVTDAEATAADSFNGASLTLARDGGAQAQDVYSATGTLGSITAPSGDLVVGGVTIGTYTHSSGTLVFSFNGAATQARVNAAMQQIAYSNTSSLPPAGVQINWLFSDGNAGAQGTGGALAASGLTMVSNSSANDPPVIFTKNRVTDGSFENGGTGWTSNASLEVSSAINSYGIGAPPNGKFFAEVEGYTASGVPSWIETTVSTVIGQTYQFTISAVSRNDTNVGDQGLLSVDGSQVLAFTTSAAWAEYTTTFVASSTTTVIRITSDGSDSGAAAAAGDTSGLLVDNVRVVSLTPAVAFTENGSPVVLSPYGSVADAELTEANNFNGATLTLARNGGANAQDLFSATGTLASISAASGNLVLSGLTIGTYIQAGGSLVFSFNSNATNAHVNSAMQQIAYANSSDSPPASLQIDWVFNDGNAGAQGSGGARTASDSTTVDITAVNDAPTLTDGSVLGLSDTDEDTTSFAVTVSTLLTGASWADADAGATQGLAVTGLVGTGSWQYSTDGSTWTNVGTVNATQALLLDAGSSLRYVPAGTNAETASFNFRAWDGTTGTASVFGTPSTANPGAGGGSSAYSSGSATASRNVTAVNDAPVLADTALTITVAEDAGVPSGAVGSLISAFTAGISDVDSGSTKGIAITATDETNGSWYYSTDGGTTWAAVGAVSDTSALLLADDASTRLYFAPAPNVAVNVTGALTLRAWDQTSGSAGSKVNTASNGGTTAFSSATDTVDVLVTAVNDAPVNTLPGTQTTPVDTPLVLGGAKAISVTDIDAASLQVTLGITNGSLTLAGTAGLSFSTGDGTGDTAMVFSGTASAINAALDGLSFTPTGGFQGTASLSITTSDLGGSGSGGTLTDTDTLDIVVGALQFQQGLAGYAGTDDTYVSGGTPSIDRSNDSPVLVDDNDPGDAILLRFGSLFGTGPGQIPAGSTITSASLSFYVTHPDATDSVSLYSMLGAWTEASTYNSLISGVQANGVEAAAFSLATLDAGVSGWVTVGGLSALVQGWANGGANNGFAFLTPNADGWAFASSEHGTVALRPYLSINFTPPQPAVVAASGGSAVFTENGAAVAVDPGLVLSDADSSQLTGASVAITTGFVAGQDTLAFSNQAGIAGSWNAGTGTLTLSGTATVAQYQAALRSITFSNNSEAPPATARTVVFSVQDAWVAGGSDSRDVDVVAVNDAPVLSAATLSLNEGQTVTLSGANFTVSDVDNGSFTYTVSGVTGGYFQMSSSAGTPVTVFSSADLAGGLVQFVDDDNEVAPAFSVTVSDGALNSNTLAATISYTPVNDAPVLNTAALTLSEGQTVTLSNANFGITDPDSGSFTFTVSGVSGGYFQLSSAAGTPITTFTTAELAGGIVQFVDDGNEVAPAFSVTVNDGALSSNTFAATINYTPVNDAPVLNTATLMLNEGQTITLSNANFGTTDPDSASFTYTVSAVTGGFFQLSSAAGAPITTFTTAELAGGVVQFVDDANEVAPAFSITANDGALNSNTLPASINYTPVNDAPVLNSATLTLSEGQTVTLSNANFGITDPDNTSFTFTLSGVTGGYFQLSSAAGAPITTFTSADLAGGVVQFVDDGDEVAPAFSLIVNDGALSSNALAASISYTPVNDAPVLNVSRLLFNPITEDELNNAGQTVASLLGSAGSSAIFDADLGAVAGVALVGSDSGNGSWQFSTDGGGQWEALGSVSEATALLLRGEDRLRLVPNGLQPTTASLTLRAWDRTIGAEGARVNISVTGGSSAFSTTTAEATLAVDAVNDAPISNTVVLTPIAEDSGPRLITQALLLALAQDADGDALQAVNLRISSGSGDLPDNGDGSWTFDPTLNFNGSVVFSFEVNDGVTVTPVSALLDITPVNDAPVSGPVTLTAINEDSGPRLITQAELLAQASDMDADTLTATDLRISSGAGTVVANGDGTWTYTPELNDNGTVVFSYRISDGKLSTEARASLSIMAVNDAPVLQAEGQTGSLNLNRNENSEAVVTLSAQDVDDATQNLRFTVVGGADAALFSLDSVTGELRFKQAPDFENPVDANAKGEYELVVRVSDPAGSQDDLHLRVRIADINDAPVLSLPDAIQFNTQPRPDQIVATARATDQDAGDTVQFALMENAGGRFVIDARSGEIRYTGAAPAALGSGSTHTVTVLVTDSQGGRQARILTLLIPGQANATEIERTPPPVNTVDTPSAPDSKTKTASPVDSADEMDKVQNIPVEATVEGDTSSARARMEEMLREFGSTENTSLARSSNRNGAGADAAAANTSANDPATVSAANGNVSFALPGIASIWTNSDSEATSQRVADLLGRQWSTSQRRDETGTEEDQDALAGARSKAANEPVEQLVLQFTKAEHVASVGFSVGLVWWLTRGGGLLASAMMGAPAWKQVDLLAVMKSRDEEEEDEEADDEPEAVKDLFSKQAL